MSKAAQSRLQPGTQGKMTSPDTPSTSERGEIVSDPDFEQYDPNDWVDAEVEFADELAWSFEVRFSAEESQRLLTALRRTDEDAIGFIHRAAMEAVHAYEQREARAVSTPAVD